MRLEELHYSGTKEGRLTWELDAETASLHADEGFVHLEGIKLKLHSSDGKVHTLESREGDYNRDTGLVEVYGDVRIDSKEGYTLRTESLSYESSTNLISSREKVEIAAPGMRVNGIGMEMEVESGSFKMLKGVRTYLTDVSN